MRKFVATAAVAASAAATLALTPLAAHAAIPSDGEIRTGCLNGVTGFLQSPAGGSEGFALSPGTSFGIPAPGAGVWTFTIHQPSALEATGPSLDEDKSFEFGTQRVEKAVVTTDDGRTMQFFNDKANSFSFWHVGAGNGFHLFYQCGIGKA